MPWNLPRFLDQARDLNLMQSVGSAYIFVHRRLLEHLAASGQEEGVIGGILFYLRVRDVIEV